LPSPPNRPPVRSSADDRRPDPPSPSSRPSKAALQPDALAAEAVDQLAGRIADLISDRVISAVMNTIIHMPGPSTARLVDAAAIAEQFGVARRYVYDQLDRHRRPALILRPRSGGTAPPWRNED
jgi:hypothetical protein